MSAGPAGAKTSQPVAIIAEAVRLPDDRSPDDRRNQAKPHL
jgi:hypothetical protein